jgi:hypothetical protein
LKSKRERVRKDNIRVEVKRKHVGETEKRFISGGRGKNILLEGTQAMPARPSDKDNNRSEDVTIVGGEILKQRLQNLVP